jgi:hypothetical protein
MPWCWTIRIRSGVWFLRNEKADPNQKRLMFFHYSCEARNKMTPLSFPRFLEILLIRGIQPDLSAAGRFLAGPPKTHSVNEQIFNKIMKSDNPRTCSKVSLIFAKSFQFETDPGTTDSRSGQAGPGRLQFNALDSTRSLSKLFCCKRECAFCEKC